MFLPDMQPDQVQAMIPAANRGPRYNMAPTQSIATIAQQTVGDTRQLMFARWGLVPSWSADLTIGNRMINARSETVDTKPSFKRAFEKRRCLIPADGYYEWMKTENGKQPYLIHAPGDNVLAMAGLWEQNQKATTDGRPILTFTVLTTVANETTAAIHDRMPVFLGENDFEQWLDPGCRDVTSLRRLLAPAAEDLLRVTPVSRQVNNARHDEPSCVDPIDLEVKRTKTQRSLFD